MSKKMKIPMRAKLISDGGLYRYISIKELSARLTIPVMRKITLSEPDVYHTETWAFQLTFVLQRVTKRFAEYQQVDCVRSHVINGPQNK